MNMVWLSSRVLGSDLCSTTQIQLANGLVPKAIQLTFIHRVFRCKYIQSPFD